jgi:putative tryptophan/tyrosine transport system substrate-binding protein
MASHIERRKFLATLGGAAVAWPLAARGQPGERMRRVGVLMNLTADDPEGQARLAAFLQGLQEGGWAVGRNVRVDIRWGANEDLMRRQAADLVALAPDVLLASANQAMVPLHRATRTIPIVFAAVTDPVVHGLVESLARPGGNVTGFTSAEYRMSAKWLELLKDVAPHVTRTAVLFEADNRAAIAQFSAIQAVAASFGVELIPAGLRNAGEIERAVTAFTRIPNGGLIVTRTTEAIMHRGSIIALAARHRLPAVYPLRVFVADGGLISYGPDIVDQYRRAAGYVDRILKGEKAADLPVQAPTKFELVINLRTAKALGIEVPPMLLARADEVIE